MQTGDVPGQCQEQTSARARYLPAHALLRRPGLQPKSCGTCGAASELIAGFVEWGLACRVDKIIVAFKTYWLRRALQLKFKVRPLCAGNKSGNQLPALLEFNPATLQAVRDYRKHENPVVSFLGEHGTKPSARS